MTKLIRSWMQVAVAAVALSVSTSYVSAACTVDIPSLSENVRVETPAGSGTYTNTSAAIPFTGTPDFGSGTYHPIMDASGACNTGKKNCDNDWYAYAEATVTRTWTKDITINMVVYTVSDAHVEAYYDKKYDGYTKVGNTDYTKNCHGYSFGVGDWPDDGAMGADKIAKVGTCYEAASHADSEIGLSGVHSLKVNGKNCPMSIGMMPCYSKSSEKFRSSAVYEQTGDCPTGIDITKAGGGPFTILKKK